MGPRISKKVHEFVMEKGSLYRLNKDKTVTKQLERINMSNGLAWSLDNKRMFYIDTLKMKVFGYDYDIVTGNIGKYNHTNLI